MEKLIKKLNKNKEDIKRYKPIISDAKKTINELEEKIRQKDLDNENKLINEMKGLKEYKEKYEELLKEKKDDEEISANIPPIEDEEEAAENIADINERRNNTRKKEESGFNQCGIDINGLDSII